MSNNAHDEWDGDGDGESAATEATPEKVQQPATPAPEQNVQGLRWRMTTVPQPQATHSDREESVRPLAGSSDALPEEKLPDTYAELLAEIKRLEAIVRHPKWTSKKITRDERAEFRRLVARYTAVKKKTHEIQQDTAAPVIGATELALGHKNQFATLRRTRWEIMAKGDMHVRDLLLERDTLDLKVSVLKARLYEYEGEKAFEE